MNFPWGPKQEPLDKNALQTALVAEDKPEPSQSDLQAALKEALAKAELAKKKASDDYQRRVLEENEAKNG